MAERARSTSAGTFMPDGRWSETEGFGLIPSWPSHYPDLMVRNLR